ncbi:TRIC cation channel family protein [Gordonia defluvii]|uniref:TRIC cation channel family protein n=1 Tax=Gordonia defluvii TaxID=283718 RepID=A0ABP6L7Q2_9ACTN
MLLTALNYLGIAAFAASGALIGVRKRLDVFGIWTLAVLTGLGGGVARDILLGVTPPVTFKGWENLTVATVSAAIVFFFHPQVGAVRRTVDVLDAFGVALFAATGALTAIHAGTSPIAAALIGVTTGLGGGILRDVLVNEVPLLIQSGEMVAIPALAGAALTVAVDGLGGGPDWALILGTAVAFGFRILVMWRGWTAPRAPDGGCSAHRRRRGRDDAAG